MNSLTRSAVGRQVVLLQCTCIRPPLLSPSLLLRRDASTSARKPTRDEAIPHPLITLVCPTTKGLLPPAPLASLLASLDRTRYAIQLVDPRHEPPICTLWDKKEEYNKLRSKKEAREGAAAAAAVAAPSVGPPKEVRLSWRMAPNDLNHKLARAKEALNKGSRVKVVFGNPRGSPAGPGAPTVDARTKASALENVKGLLADHAKVCKTAGHSKDGEVWLTFERL